MEELMRILEEARPDVDFGKETKLIDNHVLDSFDIVSIVSDIDEAFNIEIDVEDLEAENFNSAEAIWKLIQELQED